MIFSNRKEYVDYVGIYYRDIGYFTVSTPEKPTTKSNTYKKKNYCNQIIVKE